MIKEKREKNTMPKLAPSMLNIFFNYLTLFAFFTLYIPLLNRQSTYQSHNFTFVYGDTMSPKCHAFISMCFVFPNLFSQESNITL